MLARVSHFLTVTGNEHNYLVVAYATIFGFSASLTWLAFGDVLLALFRVQKVGLVYFNNTWNDTVGICFREARILCRQ